MALPFNVDGTEGGLNEGLGVAPAEAVYVGGENGIDELTAAAALTPGGAVLADGTAPGAASVGPFFGIASENEMKADDGSVLDAYASGEPVACYFEEGLRFAGVAAGAIAVGAEVECAATHGEYQAVTTGAAVGKYMGKSAAAAADRIVIHYYGGKS